MKINRTLISTFFFLFLALTPFLAFTTAFAATIRVPGDQATIQAGIDAANDGDTVLVADGTYTGEGNRDIDFKGKAITVQSENGAASCIIDCEGEGRGFNFHSGESQTSQLKGVTVTNSMHLVSGAIHCSSSSPTITNCTISGNTGTGISCWSSSSPTITNCTISGNTGKGISCSSSSSPTITNCTISGNTGTGIYCSSSSPTITNCTISGNTGTGIYCSSSSPTITNCTISGNTGTGISCWSSSSPTITNCTISGNTGKGIYCSSSSPTIEKCIIRDNLTTGSGGGVSFSSCISPTLTNCLITGNRSYVYGGAINSDSSSLTITNCTISGNIASSYSGVFVMHGFIVIKNTIIYPETDGLAVIFGSVTVTYSDIAGFTGTGAGNIDENPLFVGSGDYHLAVSSPCIDTGTSSGAPNTDIEGHPRPQGSGYDMGAYEFAPPCPDCSGGDVIITDIIFPPGRTCECVGTISITIGPGVTIPKDANVTFKAPSINVQPGFHAETGAVVNMRQQ